MAGIVSLSDALTLLGKTGSATDAEMGLLNMLIPLAEDAVRSFVGYTVTQATYTHFLPQSDFWYDEGELSFDVVNNRVTVDADTDTDRLILPELPVRSITSINEDQAARHGQGASDFSGDNLTSGTDYELMYTDSGISWTGQVRRVNGTWSQRAGTIKVVYTAGLTAAELDSGSVRGPNASSVRDIKYAALLAVVKAFHQAITLQPSSTGAVGAIQSERLADYAVTYARESTVNYSMMVDLPMESRQRLQPYRRVVL